MAELSQNEMYERLRQAKEEGEKERLESGSPVTPEESVEFLEKSKFESEDAEPETVEESRAEEIEEKQAESEKEDEKQIKELRDDIKSIPSVEMPGEDFDPDQVEDDEQDYRDKMAIMGLPGKARLFVSHRYQKGKEKVGQALDSEAGQAGLGAIGGAAVVLGAAGYVAWKIFKNILWDPTAGQFLNEPLKKIAGGGKDK